MTRQTSPRQMSMRGRLTTTSRPTSCTRDADRACFTGAAKPITFNQGMSQPLLHMDECNDPNCVDLEQLKDLQKTLDRFTDYDHYERCCDGHHHGAHHHETCRNKEEDICSVEGGSCDPTDCDDIIDDDCDECAEEHADCYEEIDVCEEDCEQCEEECEERGHDPDECPQNHPTTRDNCVTAEELPLPLPLLGPTDDFDMHGLSLQSLPDILPNITPCTVECHIPTQRIPAPIPSLISEPAFDVEMDHWQTFVQKHHCAPDPCLIDQTSQTGLPQHVDPAYGFSFGCDPSIASNQYPWQHQLLQQQQQQQQPPQCAVPYNQFHPLTQDNMIIDIKQQSPQPYSTPTTQIQSQTSSQSTTPTSTTTTTTTTNRICKWLMPCGSICGATYPRTEDLKKHVKNSHGLKGTTTCRWESCTASFATEAALTGHISKKHLSPTKDEEGPWKCTLPGCNKSFMYKQVRDEHVASHNGGNRMHCPICHQWLNAEGSNFRRHMASHGPKNEHMKCRFEALGCRRRFPRLDNLRRHEACCKFGKRAAGVHHHHHRVHVGHTGITSTTTG